MEVQRPYQRFLHERFWERSTKSRDVPPIRDWLELFRTEQPREYQAICTRIDEWNGPKGVGLEGSELEDADFKDTVLENAWVCPTPDLCSRRTGPIPWMREPP